MQEVILKTTSLSKRFGKTLAVDEVSMTVNRGDIYGFIGNNGAGKTTFMRCVLGLSAPDSGEISLFSQKSERGNALARRKIGSLIEAPGLFGDCSAKENLLRFGKLSGCTPEHADYLLELVGLPYVGKKKAGKFSLGMKQRLGIAVALLGNPELLILDEPINGLDPEGIKEIRDLILQLNRENNVTFLISSHLLEELNKVATRYGIIDHGRIVEEVSAEDVEKMSVSGIELGVENVETAMRILDRVCPDAQKSAEGNIITLTNPRMPVSKINALLVGGGAEVFRVVEKKSDAEQFFLERMSK
ncbi:MAG: ATP-binding cassette domain-containing protein [Candidatus Neoclostridium sp.]